MRTVLLGSDFMYDQNGDLKILEINTNVTLNVNDKVENTSDVFDFSELDNFIVQNNFTTVIYIGNILELDTDLKTFCTNNSLTYSFYNIGGNALTVPYVEDNDQTLIIRSAYDTTAIIDDTYCADNYNFEKLIQNQTFSVGGFSIIDDEGNLVNTLTTIPDNGPHPNFILKSRYPSYDINVYPKLFRVTTQAELDTVISQNVSKEFMLTPYLYNPSKLYNGTHVQVLRSFSLLYPPTLQSINLGQCTTIGGDAINENPTYDSTTFELDNTIRNRYLTKQPNYDGYPKLRATDRVLLADGTWASPGDLQVGTMLKTIQIPNPSNVDASSEVADYQITFDQFNQGTVYKEDKIVGIQYVNTLNRLAKITFTDGSIWNDGAYVNFLADINDDIQWKPVYTLKAGDKLIALSDLTSSTVFSEAKEIQSIELYTDFFSGWAMTVETDHLWIVNDTTTNNTFALVEHNTACTACIRQCTIQCPACPVKTQPACASAPAPAICTTQC